MFSKQMTPAGPNPVPSFSVSLCPHRAVFHLGCLASLRNIMGVAHHRPPPKPFRRSCNHFRLSCASQGPPSLCRLEWSPSLCPDNLSHLGPPPVLERFLRWLFWVQMGRNCPFLSSVCPWLPGKSVKWPEARICCEFLVRPRNPSCNSGRSHL